MKLLHLHLVIAGQTTEVTANRPVDIISEGLDGLGKLLLGRLKVLLGALAAVRDELDEAEHKACDSAVGDLQNSSNWEGDNAGGDAGKEAVLANHDVDEVVVDLEELYIVC